MTSKIWTWFQANQLWFTREGHSHMPCSHNCDHSQFFQSLTVDHTKFWGLHCDCNLWPLRHILHAANTVSVTCGSRRELVLLHLWLHCRNKDWLLLVLCTYDLFSATGLVPRPPVLFTSQPFATGTATLQYWLRWHVTHEKLDRSLGTRLIFTLKSDRFRVLWPLTSL